LEVVGWRAAFIVRPRQILLRTRGAGITRTAFDDSSRALRLAWLCALRIGARRNRKLPQLQRLIAKRSQVHVVFATLPLLDFVHRLESQERRRRRKNDPHSYSVAYNHENNVVHDAL
jgi:hypothetical protein